jgi:UDP-N-acetylglucosamine enolpyruvyl transferase
MNISFEGMVQTITNGHTKIVLAASNDYPDLNDKIVAAINFLRFGGSEVEILGKNAVQCECVERLLKNSKEIISNFFTVGKIEVLCQPIVANIDPNQAGFYKFIIRKK